MSVVRMEVDSRGVATLTLNRPAVRNALDDELIGAVTSSLENLAKDVRVLVLAGAGPAFCAGADLGWMRSMSGFTREENIADSTKPQRMFEALDSCAVPVVGRVHGAAIAGATGLVACCDVAVASERCVFAFTEVRLGLVPAVISPYVVRRVGYSFARSAFLTGERFDAGRAREAGLVHRVVAEDELDAAVEEVVGLFLEAGPRAVRETRKLLDAVWGRQPAEVREVTVRAIADARVSEEGQEGMLAFFEKRRPAWAPATDADEGGRSRA